MRVAHPAEWNDGKAGTWSRAQLVTMNNMALARMTAIHPGLCPPDIRAALKKALLPDKKVNPQAAEKLLEELFGALPELVTEEESPAKIDRIYVETAKVIRTAIAAKHGLTILDLDSDCRTAKLCRARQEAMYLVTHETALSFPRIGRMFGGKDHTTVMHAVRTHALKNGLPPPRGLRPKPLTPDEFRERDTSVNGTDGGWGAE